MQVGVGVGPGVKREGRGVRGVVFDVSSTSDCHLGARREAGKLLYAFCSLAFSR